MKPNKMIRKDRHGAWFVMGSVLVTIALIGVYLAYNRLRDVYLEQCIITDFSAQVKITEGKIVKADVIADELGLKKNANLALIDFAERRAAILKKIPTLRSLTITRQLPNKITVVAEDRTPVARVNIAGNKKSSGKVVDSEGVVFSLYPGTSMLPTIYEKKLAASEPGMQLKKRALSALRLLETCRQPEFQDLGVLDVDITKDDYILATLGDYSRVKIAWEGMDDFSPESKIRMTAQLNELAKAIRTRTAPAQMWNATVPGAVALDPKGSNQ
jgi:hypothetical protein